MTKIEAVLGLILERGGVITASSTAAIHFHNAIDITPLVLRRRYRGFPCGCGGGFPIQKSCLSPIDKGITNQLKSLQKNISSRGEMPIVGVFVK